MEVFRIEHKSLHLGPFNYDDVNPDFGRSYAYQELVMYTTSLIPWQYDGIEARPDIVLAFPSMAQCYRVFPQEYLTELEEQWGFVVRTIDIPDNEIIYGESRTQVAIPIKYVLDAGLPQPEWLILVKKRAAVRERIAEEGMTFELMMELAMLTRNIDPNPQEIPV